MPNIADTPKNHLAGFAILFSLCGYILLAGHIDLFPGYGVYNEKRIIQVILLGITSIIAILFFRRDITKILCQLPLPSKALLSLLFFLGIVSTIINSSNYKQSLLELGLIGLLFVTTLFVSALYRMQQEQFHKIVLTCLLLTASLYIVIAGGGYIASLIEPIPLLPYELFLNFSHPRFFNQLQSWTLPLIILPILLFRPKKTFHKKIYILIAIGWWLLLFISGGRGTLLGIGISMLLVIIFFNAYAKDWIKWQLTTAISAFTLYLIFFLMIPILANSSPDNVLGFSALRSSGSSGRDFIWLTAWDLLQHNYLLGIGPANFACETSPFLPAHPHNTLIQIATEWGIPAAAILAFLFLWGIRQWMRWSKKQMQHHAAPSDQNLINIALFASLTTAAVHALFSGIIIMPHSQVMLVIILGWMLGRYHLNHAATVHTSLAGKALILLTAASLLALLIGMYPVLNTFNLDQLPLQQLPRFWQQGRFCY